MAGIIDMHHNIGIANEQAKNANLRRERSEQDNLRELQSIHDRVQDQYEGNAKALAAAEMQIKIFGSAIGNMFIRIFEPFGNAIVSASDKIMTKMGPAMTELAKEGGPIDKLAKKLESWINDHIDPIIKWFQATFKALSDAKPDEFWKTLGEKLKEGASNIWKEVKPAFVAIWEGMKPIIIDAFKAIFEMMKDVLIGPKITKENQATYELQNEKNKSVMTPGERASTFASEFLEGIVGIFSSDLAKRIAAGRIQDDTEYGIADKRLDPNSTQVALPQFKPVQKASGSWGTAGKLIENFGSGTPAVLHGNEGVITEAQLNQIMTYAMKSGSENKSDQILQMLNSTMQQLLAINREQAEYIKRNVDATKRLGGNLLA
jgi:hypothetical protein